jgi:ABC-type transport system substrate-binding protein
MFVFLGCCVASAVEEVNIGCPADPNDLSPFAGLSLGRLYVNRTLYEYLIDRNEFGGEMVGCIMKNYQKIDENTYDVTIYDYVYDTEGNHITAEDVAFSYNQAIKMGYLPKLKVITECKAIDEYTVRFKFESVKVGDLEALWSECPIVSRKAYEESPDQMVFTPVGSTAYRLADYVPGSKIVFERTNNHWQKNTALLPIAGQANVDRIVLQIIPENAQRIIALETGAIDLAAFSNPKDVARFENKEGFAVTRNKRNLTDVLVFNCSDQSPLKNKALRQAICYAIDTEAMVKGVLGGEGFALKSFVGHDKYADFNKKWNGEEYYPYNPQKAKELLKEAGYKPGALNLVIVTDAQETHKKEAQIIQSYLRAIGISSNIFTYEAAMFNKAKMDPSAYDLLITEFASTDYLVNIWKLMLDAEQFGGTTMNWVKDDYLQQLLDTARSLDGHTQENVDALHYYVKDQAYFYGLIGGYDYIVHKSWIRKLFLDARGFVIPGACEYLENS